MIANKKHKKLYMRRSCLTDKVVWLHWSVSGNAKNACYCRAKKHDARLAKQWPKMEERRRKVVLFILGECLDDIPITQPLTPEQREAGKRLQALADERIPFYRAFSDHVREERRRRNKHLKMMRERRQREAAQKVHSS